MPEKITIDGQEKNWKGVKYNDITDPNNLMSLKPLIPRTSGNPITWAEFVSLSDGSNLQLKIDELAAKSSGIEKIVVKDSLDSVTTEEKTHKYLYLVPKTQGGTDYVQYMWDSDSSAWTNLGPVGPDVSAFAKKEDLEALRDNVAKTGVDQNAAGTIKEDSNITKDNYNGILQLNKIAGYLKKSIDNINQAQEDLDVSYSPDSSLKGGTTSDIGNLDATNYNDFFLEDGKTPKYTLSELMDMILFPAVDPRYSENSIRINIGATSNKINFGDTLPGAAASAPYADINTAMLTDTQEVLVPEDENGNRYKLTYSGNGFVNRKPLAGIAQDPKYTYTISAVWNTPKSSVVNSRGKVLWPLNGDLQKTATYTLTTQYPVYVVLSKDKMDAASFSVTESDKLKVLQKKYVDTTGVYIDIKDSVINNLDIKWTQDVYVYVAVPFSDAKKNVFKSIAMGSPNPFEDSSFVAENAIDGLKYKVFATIGVENIPTNELVFQGTGTKPALA